MMGIISQMTCLMVFIMLVTEVAGCNDTTDPGHAHTTTQPPQTTSSILMTTLVGHDTTTQPPYSTNQPTTQPPYSTTQPPYSTNQPTAQPPYSTNQPTTQPPYSTNQPTTQPPYSTNQPTTQPPYSTNQPTTQPPYSTNQPTTQPPYSTHQPTTQPPYSTNQPTTQHPYSTNQPTTQPPYSTNQPTTESPYSTYQPTTESPYSTNQPTTESPYSTDQPTTEPPYSTNQPTTESPYSTDQPTTEPPYSTNQPTTESPYSTDQPTTESPYSTTPELSSTTPAPCENDTESSNATTTGDEKCTDRGGVCSTAPVCEGGTYVAGLCAGPANRKCCIKDGFKCYGDFMKLKPGGASAQTAKQDKLAITGVPASNKMVDADLAELNKRKDCYVKAGKKHCIHPAVIAAIASRESRGGRLLYATGGWGDNGRAWGIMQCDIKNSGIGKDCTKHAWGSCEHIDQMTELLVSYIKIIQEKHSTWCAEYHIKGGVAAYNVGTGNVRTIANMDVGTTGDDYSDDVIARAQRLVNEHGW